MCPLCVTSLALMSTGATTAGGLAAVVMKSFGSRKRALEFEKQSGTARPASIKTPSHDSERQSPGPDR
jgi:hypothetical protein